jgi:hypothetical protein
VHKEAPRHQQTAINHMPDDLFPSLDNKFQRRVAEKLQTHFGDEAPTIAKDSWDRLKPILAAYKREAEYLRRFLNKGQAAKLRIVAQRSGKLLAAIEDADDAGLSKIIKDCLKEATLDAIRHELGTWSQELDIEAREEPFLEDRSRENLYRNFENWWRQATGENPKIEEGMEGFPPPTAFMFVAREVFNLHGMPHPTGSSYKALKDQRRNSKARSKKIKKLGEMLNELANRSSDNS